MYKLIFCNISWYKLIHDNERNIGIFQCKGCKPKLGLSLGVIQGITLDASNLLQRWI